MEANFSGFFQFVMLLILVVKKNYTGFTLLINNYSLIPLQDDAIHYNNVLCNIGKSIHGAL